VVSSLNTEKTDCPISLIAVLVIGRPHIGYTTHKGEGSFITSADEVMFSHLLVCLSVNKITQLKKLWMNFVIFCGGT